MTARRGAATAASLLLPLVAVVACSGPAAPQGTATPLAPVSSTPAATPTTSAAVKTLRTDVDGDGSYDSVELFSLGSDRWRLAVTTTKGATSAVEFTSMVPEFTEYAHHPLHGAVTLDGRKGSELVVHLWDARESAALAVYTWRSGALVAERAPASPGLKGWYFGDLPTKYQGARFFDSHGRRYVDVAALAEKSPAQRWVGKITRSVWKKDRWVRTSTRSVKLTRSKAAPYLGYSGPPILLGVTSAADIDGDGSPDEVRYYRDRHNPYDNAFRFTVTPAAGKVVTKTLPAEQIDPLLGLAELDGAAGSDLILRTYSEDPIWQVLTWRKGKLVDEPSPATNTYNESSPKYWIGGGDEAMTRLTFSTAADGTRHVLVAITNREYTEESTTEFTESVWRAGTWVKLTSWTEPLSEAEWDSFERGVHGVDLLKP
jgi:hypothetical protein